MPSDSWWKYSRSSNGDQLLDVVAEPPHPLRRERRHEHPAQPGVVGLLGVVVARGPVLDGRVGDRRGVPGRRVGTPEPRVAEQLAELVVARHEPGRITGGGAHGHDRPLAAQHVEQRRHLQHVGTVERELGCALSGGHDATVRFLHWLQLFWPCM
jgi:hypothetical protein